VDRPDDFLKPHRKPIPYLGGVAMFLGWSAGLVVALVLFGQRGAPAGRLEGPGIYFGMAVPILIAGLAITLLGLLDDLRMFRPVAKLAGTVAVGLFLVCSGLGEDIIRVVTSAVRMEIGPHDVWLVWVYSVPLSLFILVGACNAANLIDGVDGLCSGVLGIISVGFLVIACHMHCYAGWDPIDSLRVVLSLAMLGAAFGFLPYNRHPATIFMGDAGSMLLGLNAGVMIILFGESHMPRWMLAALMVFGLPLADMVLTVIRRWRNQKPLTMGDRSHFYDQLLDRGMSVRNVVAICYVLSAIYVAVGCVSIWLRTRYAALVYLVITAATIVAIAAGKMVRLEDRPGSGRDA
jgi:UDP-GlcNAc:undecaprenyl-phosphate GlcNAc-1-phosphate transferase